MPAESLPTTSIRRRFLAFLLLVFCLLFFPLSAWSERGHLFIYHIDVGQGDSTLIVSPEGKTLLIDGGNNGVGARKVVPLLKKLRITSLDYMVATHYDADHIGGLDEVVQAFSVAKAYDRGKPGREDTTKTYQDYVASLGDKRSTISPGEGKIDLGASVTVLCMAVNGEVHGGRKVELSPNDENDASVALKIRYGGFDYFIGGDLTGGGRSGTRRTKDVESLVAPVVGDVDVLKVSHHGSLTSSNETVLTALRPEVAVISVGDGGSNRSRRIGNSCGSPSTH